MTRIVGDGRDEQYMRLALERAAAAAEHDDVPIGAVVVRNGEVIGAAGNERELRQDPTAHAECLAIRAASLTLGGWRLVGAELYCTLEPCPMCAGAIQQARIGRVIYGAPDQKIGAAGTVIDLLRSPRMLQRVQVTPGVLAAESQELLRSFFASRR
ncbi:MAG TPA: tRNA adenosine(34) deaminase TadA [Miltoncostaeales bacterium]|nr:tRNA adenosine(34) deaminase TadA [Miltoncostaeales bacterium]